MGTSLGRWSSRAWLLAALVALPSACVTAERADGDDVLGPDAPADGDDALMPDAQADGGGELPPDAQAEGDGELGSDGQADGGAELPSPQRRMTQGRSFQNGLAGYEGTTDTFLREAEHDKAFGAAETCEITGFDGSLRDKYCLIRWDLSGIPRGARVLSASLSLYAIDGSISKFDMYGMRRAWDEATATWSIAQADTPWQSDGADGPLDRGPVVASLGAKTGKRETYSLSQAGVQLVQSWVDGALNAGFQIGAREATDAIIFASSEHPQVEWRPRLVVSYELPSEGAASDAPLADCVWRAFQEEGQDYDAIGSRLCDEFRDPLSDERYFISCRVEGVVADTSAPQAKDELIVMTWNMERNYHIEGQIRAIREGLLPMPDVILAGEVDRGCGRSSKVNGGYEFARALGFHYVFGVEFVELTGPETDTPCEHGQAIFSRYPLGNVNLFRHTPSGNDEYDRAEQPRVGTRSDIEADVLVGDRCVRVVSVHYDDKVEEEPARTLQATETADRGLDFPVHNYVVGGDMNTTFYFQDPSPMTQVAPAARALWDRGYYDAHYGVPERITVPFKIGPITVSAVVDLLWVRSSSQVKDPRWCSTADCGALSDHLPQWFTLELR